MCVCVCGGGRGGKEVKTAKHVWKRGLYGSANPLQCRYFRGGKSLILYFILSISFFVLSCFSFSFIM